MNLERFRFFFFTSPYNASKKALLSRLHKKIILQGVFFFG